MTAPNAITAIQDAYVKKVIDTLNDLPNVLWIVSEEAPKDSAWWNSHLIDVARTYEAGKPHHHPIGYAVQADNNDATILNSNADWIAPAGRISPTISSGAGNPPRKVSINDSDHSYFGIWNDSPLTNRNYFWINFTNGNQTLFMDPYVVNYPRETRNLAAMTPQGKLSSTGHVLANTEGEFMVYAPSGNKFTLNLAGSSGQFSVEWMNPATGAKSTGEDVIGGATRTFTPPFNGDAVLYLKR